MADKKDDVVSAALAAPVADKSVPAKVRDSAALPGAVTMRAIPTGNKTDDGEDEVRETIVQEEYGEWPWCNLCQPSKQVEPTSFSAHTNKHTVASVED